ncbi:hypothetical protein CBL_08548 [Carabus blaptoides fortunei]
MILTKRRSWVTATGRSLSDFSEKSILFVCEDHFNLEVDMENYIKFKITGGQKLIKNDVVPHIFNCQPNRKRTHSKPEQEDNIKRRREQLVEEAMKMASRTELVPSTRTELALSTSTVEYRETEESVCVQNNDQMYKDIAVQVKPSVKHKVAQCNMRSKSVEKKCCPIKLHLRDSGNSPFKIPPTTCSKSRNVESFNKFSESSSDSDTESSSENSATVSSHSSTSNSSNSFEKISPSGSRMLSSPIEIQDLTSCEAYLSFEEAALKLALRRRSR